MNSVFTIRLQNVHNKVVAKSHMVWYHITIKKVSAYPKNKAQERKDNMSNMVTIKGIFSAVKPINNIDFPFVGIIEKKIEVNRRFLFTLEENITALKELCTVEVNYNGEKVAILEKNAYQIAGKEAVTFQRFGGKIAKEFYNAIDEEIERLENAE